MVGIERLEERGLGRIVGRAGSGRRRQGAQALALGGGLGDAVEKLVAFAGFVQGGDECLPVVLGGWWRLRQRGLVAGGELLGRYHRRRGHASGCSVRSVWWRVSGDFRILTILKLYGWVT